MHEQATITSAGHPLGNPGYLVSISKVAEHYTTTAQANHGIAYVCADPHCKIKVRAVIPLKTKPGRRTSPAPYFRGKHIAGCTRKPLPETVTLPPAEGDKPAHPNRESAPAIWIDPRLQAPATGGSTGDGSQTGNPGNAGLGGFNGGGTGTSQRSSKIIENFASEWKSMTVYERQQTPLTAPWNLGGSYYDAFFPLHYYAKTPVDAMTETIFVGAFKSLLLGTSGYVITLVERHPDGRDLRIWIQNPTFNVQPGGAALQATLATLVKTPPQQPVQIYTLGTFSEQSAKNGNYKWYSLIVTHPHLIWIDV